MSGVRFFGLFLGPLVALGCGRSSAVAAPPVVPGSRAAPGTAPGAHVPYDAGATALLPAAPAAGAPFAPLPELGPAAGASVDARGALALGSPWSYVLPVDHGMRWDLGGKGYFGAPRAAGGHTGVDFLAPLGTPVLAPCAGQAHAGTTDGLGLWVHLVCPVPEALGAGLHASLLFAHLATEDVGAGLERVGPGAALGSVGKSGAEGPYIAPHLHLELIVHASEAAALAERHLVDDASDEPGADRFFAALEARCLAPAGFGARKAEARCGRRIDPFVALSCLTLGKPPPTAARWPVGSASMPWSEVYAATGFDVELGRAAPPAPARAPSEPVPALRAVLIGSGD
ncbi:MAG: M23 family metallopeptidase [Myxococcales bacterium]|nr:M23 family metallopeptidase [Myxococcales bacterium]